MKKFVLIFACLYSLSGIAQKGQQFPAMKGTTLDDKAVSIPTKNGKYTIIGIAYNRAAEEELKKWLNPTYYNFIKKGDANGQFDVAELYDVNFYFIPLISGFKKARNDFKNGTDKEFHGYILDAETSIDEVKKQLKITDDKIPYFYVLDENGKIVEAVSGNYTEAKMDKLEDAVE
jgi:ATP synthase subunit 10